MEYTTKVVNVMIDHVNANFGLQILLGRVNLESGGTTVSVWEISFRGWIL